MDIQTQIYPINDAQTGLLKTGNSLENYFSQFRRHIIGQQQTFVSPCGEKKIIYGDWTASGRGYQPIETYIQNEVLPFVGNTHTETTITGTLMSAAYAKAKVIVKHHVNACDDDILVFCGSGMTGAVNKLQRILGLRVPERMEGYAQKDSSPLQLDEELRPVVFVTHMEHHSNHTSWLETIADVEIINPDINGNVDLAHFRALLQQYRYKKNKIAAITACSNVTGILTPYHEIANIIHAYDGLCFVDFACSAPYVDMNMHPGENGACLDAIYFSPHKFLGGPGTCGVLIFNKKIYTNTIPDQPGGGTIVYSNPWGMHKYTGDIEQREDGGTPPFLQAIKVAMCIKLKEKMGVENMLQREEQLRLRIFNRFAQMKNVEVLAGNLKERLGVFSFIVTGTHYNLIVKILNDRFGIQTRGGCSCAGTYGHVLLGVSPSWSFKIHEDVRSGHLFSKPGWIRLSVHPTMTNAEIDFIMDAIEMTANHFNEWVEDYDYDAALNEYVFKESLTCEKEKVADWFDAFMN